MTSTVIAMAVGLTAAPAAAIDIKDSGVRLTGYSVGVRLTDNTTGVRLTDNTTGVRLTDNTTGVRLTGYSVGVRLTEETAPSTGARAALLGAGLVAAS